MEKQEISRKFVQVFSFFFPDLDLFSFLACFISPITPSLIYIDLYKLYNRQRNNFFADKRNTLLISK